MPPSPPRSVVVATHGHCFDGLASATLFTELAHHVGIGDATFSYRGCGYGPGQNGVDPAVLSGDENAILDFRYSTDARLSWYFDHHKTAFPTPDDRAHFDADTSGRKFWDAAYGSCTKLIADVGRARFGLALGEGLDELVRWADVIDAARFASAEMAVRRTEPAIRLMAVIEHHGDDAFLARMVPRLRSRSLAEVAADDDVVALYRPMEAAQEAFVALVREKSRVMGRVVYVDLADETIDVAAKFVTYALFPESDYSVMVTRGKDRCKLSIGHNPWCGRPRTHDVSAICSRHGGGGHPVVGAISLAPSEVERARELGLAIARELDG